MARIRSIKPDFFRHEGLYEAERSSGLPIRLAFAGLWTACDREGRFAWAPKTLKLDCLPHDEVDFAIVLDALATAGFITKYEVAGKAYGYIKSWHEHQHINQREAQSKIPDPSSAVTCLHVLARGEGKGREGKGREDKTADAASSDYAFNGAIVKLNRKHFGDWTAAFQNLDLTSELTARDAWLGSDRATLADRENWFISTSKYLANRNAEARIKMATSGPDRRVADPRL